MQYENIIPGIFRERPNRFIAMVEIAGQLEKVHVKNTGRCRELLVPGAQVWCQLCENTGRKTKYDLISVKKGDRMINMDSQAPNAAVKEWLLSGGFGEIENLKPESFYGESRFDFAFLQEGRQCYLEVKGVTLEEDGVCAFPDAPTDRGVKHLRELIRAAEAGYSAYVLFVIQMSDVKYFRPRWETDPDFAETLKLAKKKGVAVLAADCSITPDTMELRLPVPVRL